MSSSTQRNYVPFRRVSDCLCCFISAWCNFLRAKSYSSWCYCIRSKTYTCCELDYPAANDKQTCIRGYTSPVLLSAYASWIRSKRGRCCFILQELCRGNYPNCDFFDCSTLSTNVALCSGIQLELWPLLDWGHLGNLGQIEEKLSLVCGELGPVLRLPDGYFTVADKPLC